MGCGDRAGFSHAHCNLFSHKFVTKSIMRELLPNSGESMRDSIEDTKIELRILSARVDSIYEILGGK
jgi:hypothetical protein